MDNNFDNLGTYRWGWNQTQTGSSLDAPRRTGPEYVHTNGEESYLFSFFSNKSHDGLYAITIREDGSMLAYPNMPFFNGVPFNED